ncbi:hypothetical protein B0T25DRAFT_330761 [Lasiosphaeria hispida]|uniref:Uncharacterized protein n=1 Tax=Lasiosphaeria hispida TaxID=260671 RepID=A0AAJ0M7V2_9PEZI|nr:hypothetical protein B0T25DRAFT_330761 [Lasiosphaeria hispida]
MYKPLSESLQKLRRAQRALVRRKRRSKVRVSFDHSNSSRNSGIKAAAAKRSSRQLKQADTQRTPRAVPNTWPEAEAEIRNSVRKEKDQGPYPPFHRQDPSSREDGCCPGSPSERRPEPAKAGLEGYGRPSLPQPKNRPYWGTLPSSPVRSPPKPTAQLAPQRVASEYVQTGNVEGRLKTSQANRQRQPSVERRPLPAIPASPRYSVFPKPPPRRRPPIGEKERALDDVVHSESARRSLSQQRRLSLLVPSENPSATTRPSPVFPYPTPGTTANITTRTPSQQKKLANFTRELEEFAVSTGAVGKLPVTTPTPTPTETHISVHTVQELLPYRHEFQAAGLAVTSVDQKGPEKTEKSTRSRGGRSHDDRLRLDGASQSAQGSSSTESKESSNETVIHFRGHDNPLPSALIDEVPQKGKNGENQSGKTNPPLEPPPTSDESGERGVAERRGIKPRPSAIFLTNKPLPAKPNSTRPTQDARESRRYSKVSNGQTERELPAVPIERTQASIGSCTLEALQPMQGVHDKPEKSLPALPVLRLASQIRQGATLPIMTSWVPVTRELPTTIVEEREPSPDKFETPSRGTCIGRHKDEVVIEIQNKRSSTTQTTAALARSSTSCTPELPETWKHAIGTPSSFERALDDVVRKLEDMGEPKAAVESAKTRNGSRRTSSKPPSPSQRLQHAAALRRQRIAEAAMQNGEFVKSPATPPGPACLVEKPLARTESTSHERAKFLSVIETAPAHEDQDISDRDVLKGLKIICAASADAELDAWIRSKTGLRLRRFLADLKTFESLSQDGIAAVDDQRTRRRRAERRRLQAERDTRRRSIRRQS